MFEFRHMLFESLSNAQLYDIMALREEVFTLEQKCTERDFDGLDKKAIHVFAVARILPKGVYKKGVVSFGRLAVKKSHRGRGCGRETMHSILNYINRYYPGIPVRFSAQQYLKIFMRALALKQLVSHMMREAFYILK